MTSQPLNPRWVALAWALAPAGTLIYLTGPAGSRPVYAAGVAITAVAFGCIADWNPLNKHKEDHR